MPEIYFARISNDKSGFTNQIFSLVNAILQAKERNMKFIVLDSFQRDFMDSTKRISCGDLFDLEETNKYLKQHNLTLLCNASFDYKLNAVFYGQGENVIDITEIAPETIKPRTYNSIGGDPSPGIVKELFINYTINGNEYSDIYNEFYNFPIWVKGTPTYEYLFRWINHQPLFEDIMKNIKYQKRIDDYPFTPVYKDNVNVVHLRLEDDAIQHWSKQNKMDTKSFKESLEQKYIQLVRDNIDPTKKTIIVGSKDNPVIDYMNHNKYDYIYYELNLNGREINAVYDLIQASACTETFISNFNYENLNGSTFSYYISLLSKPKKTISIDIDYIKN